METKKLRLPDDYKLEHQSYAEAEIEFEELNEHRITYIKSIPLSEIRNNLSAENDNRRMSIPFLREQIRLTGKVQPILLAGKRDGKYEIEDGRHRCRVAQELGYTHIPASLARWMETHPRNCYPVEEQISYPRHHDPLGGTDLYITDNDGMYQVFKIGGRLICTYDYTDNTMEWENEKYARFHGRFLNWICTDFMVVRQN